MAAARISSFSVDPYRDENMSITPQARRKTSATHLQALEERRLLTVFGNAWPDQRDLAISFPADGVQVGDVANDLNVTLDAVAPRQQWQELALRAYQTWAINADINIGLRNDFNTDFGVPGLTTQDPRFGEFRVGAFPQTGVLASSVPFQAVAGTYSGDLLLNSSQQWSMHDWADGVAPDPATGHEDDRDVFTLLLHEAGNTLGLPDTVTDWTVMFGHYAGPKGALTAEDIDSIQSIYGARTDPYELVDNGQMHVASLVTTPPGIDLSANVIRTRGSLLSGSDVDYYKIVPASGHDTATVRIRAEGISLVQSRIEVVDALGQVIQQADAQSVFQNDASVTLSGLAGYDEVFVRVSPRDPDGVYAVGDYLLEVDYRDAAVQALDPIPGAYDAGPDMLFGQYGLADAEIGDNDTLFNATEIEASPHTQGDRYEFESAVSSAADIDYFKIKAPANVQGKLHVTLAGLDASGPDLRVSVVNGDGEKVGTAGYLRSDGTFVVEVAQPTPLEDYFVRVSVDPTSAVGVGDYIATAEYEAPSEQMHDLVSNTVSGDKDDFVRWTAGVSKLYRFDLSSVSASVADAAGSGVKMTVYDAHTREPKMAVLSHAGVTRGALAWLDQGEYIIRFTAVSIDGSAVNDLDYSVRVASVSDDMDDTPYDPNDPNPDDYTYDYEYDYYNYYDYDYVEVYYPDYY